MDRSRRAAAREWAYEEFGHAELGDRRRTSRLVRMLAAIAERPAGKVVEVFRSSAERQGAYDFLSNDAVRPDALLASIQQATAMRSSEEPFVYVVVDGTSLRLTIASSRRTSAPSALRPMPRAG